MKRWTTWFVALTSALLGAATMHLSSRLPEAQPQPRTDLVAEVEGESIDEPTEETFWRESIQRKLGPLEPAAPASAARAVPSILSKLAGQNPMAMLTLEQKKTMLRHKYGALFRELELSPDESDRLVATLSNQESRSLSGPRRAGFATKDDAEAERDRAEISAAIGSTKAAAFEELRATLPARFELRRFRDQLEDAGEAMTPEQHRALVDIISAQGPESPPKHDDGATPEESINRYREWVSERDRSLRHNAAAVLSPSQLKTLDESQAIREAMRPQLGSAAQTARTQAGSGG